MEIVIAQLLAFFAVFLLITGIPALFRSDAEALESNRFPVMLRPFYNEISSLSGLGERLVKVTPEVLTALKVTGFQLTPRQLRGMQLFTCLTAGAVCGVLAFLTTLQVVATPAGFFFGALIGWIYPATWLKGKAKQRQEEMSRTLPFAIDLLTVAMEAGQDFVASVRHLVNEGLRGPLAEEFGRVLREIELGKSREEALKAMGDRVQLPEFNSLVASVMQSAEMGASIAQTLKIQAEEIRRDRFHRAERKAARAPSLMLIPMALFILPAVFIIIFTPVIIRVMDSGIGAYFGQ